MTALEIALSGYLAFGQLTGNSYEAITKHSGLHAVRPADAPCLTATGRELTECGLAIRLSGDYDSSVFEWTSQPDTSCPRDFSSTASPAMPTPPAPMR